MGEDREKQHSWLGQGLIPRPWGCHERSAIKDQEAACGWFGASLERPEGIGDELGEA